MKGIISKAIGGFFFPADNQQNIYTTKIRGKVKEKVYPGDYVDFTGDMIEGVYPRKNLLFRPNVANVDQVLVVQAVVQPALDRKLLDRFLVMVEEAQLLPVIVINKVDLLSDLDGLKQELQPYEEAGYQLLFVSVKGGLGLEELVNLLHGKVNVLTGPSGVGKSSLINKIISGARLEVGDLSQKLRRGVHTTRHVELLPVKDGGWVADTPGFSSLDINYISLEDLPFLYPEFDQYLEDCKFRGCSHTHEPGCAVKKAVEKGEIARIRYESYQTFYQEIKETR